MSAALPVLAAMPEAQTRFFLGVEKSARGRAWRDRLDARGTALALAIAQHHGVPEMLARILAGRGVEAADAESYLDPAVKRLMPDPDTLTGMREAASRIADAIGRGESVAIFGDYDVDGATSSALAGALSASLRPAADHPYSGSAFSKATGRMSMRCARSASAVRLCWSRSIAGPHRSSRLPKRKGSAWKPWSSIITNAIRCCRPRLRSSIRTGSTICPA